jgi:hypothetical protein
MSAVDASGRPYA